MALLCYPAECSQIKWLQKSVMPVSSKKIREFETNYSSGGETSVFNLDKLLPRTDYPMDRD